MMHTIEALQQNNDYYKDFLISFSCRLGFLQFRVIRYCLRITSDKVAQFYQSKTQKVFDNAENLKKERANFHFLLKQIFKINQCIVNKYLTAFDQTIFNLNSSLICLPSEIKQQIFYYCPLSERMNLRVCQILQQDSHLVSFDEKINGILSNKISNEDFISLLKKEGHLIKRLNISKVSLYITHNLLIKITKYCPHLTTLYLNDCNNLIDLSSLSNLINLTTLDLKYCNNLTDLSPLSALTNLKTLHLRDCYNLKDLSPLSNLTNLTTLDLKYCYNLKNLFPLSALTNLKTLHVNDCLSLTDLSPLSSLTNLTTLDLKGSYNLTDLSPLLTLTNLTTLDLNNCRSLINLSSLSNLTSLTILDLKCCFKLTNLSALSNLTNLTTLDLNIDYYNLTELYSLSNLTNLTIKVLC